ncbi:hypothetical protein [Pseudotenacibaculum haliotis]|uniref:Uncharacterized protein n=1 Tax=Pseudotenacibaculum haliotis TaxID=1862138 RepID=A0ABW5LNS9_9FLAO
MSDHKDIMLDETDDLMISGGDFFVGESLTQETGIILRLNQGDLKSDPILGPNLIQLEHGVESESDFVERVRIHLKRDNKNYNAVKSRINMNFKKQ